MQVSFRFGSTQNVEDEGEDEDEDKEEDEDEAVFSPLQNVFWSEHCDSQSAPGIPHKSVRGSHTEGNEQETVPPQ